MTVRKLTQAELRQRRAAAPRGGPTGGRPRKNSGTRAARRAVEEARALGRAAQPAAARVLIAGMHGQIPGQTPADQIASAKEVLNRWGNPALAQIEDISTRPDTHLHLNLEGAAFPPQVKPPTDDDSDDPGA